MKKAFTMIELVFVIVVIGILAAVIIPSTRTNPVQEAAIQLLSHIKYTQHLAMVDDKYDASITQWEKGRWQMVFSTNANGFSDNRYAYTIFSDSGAYGGSASFGEVAKNPENSNQIMTGGYATGTMDITDSSFLGMRKLNLGLSYGISTVQLSGGCNGVHITFDSLGRPLDGTHTSSTSSHALITSDCNLTISNGSESASIIIRPETGYASVNF